MIVVRTKGRMETVFRVLRSSIAPLDGIKSGCLAWGNEVELDGETHPVLAYAWGERLWLLRAFMDEDGQLSLAHVGEWTGVSDVVGLRWSGTWLWIWTREGDVVIWSYRAGKAIERFGLLPDLRWDDGRDSFEEPNLSTMTLWDSRIGPARSSRGSQGGMLGSVLFQCGDRKIWQGSWRSWEDRLGLLIGSGRLLAALEMAVGYAASLPGLDIEGYVNDQDRRRIVGVWIMTIVRKVLSLGVQEAEREEGDMATEVQAQAYQLAKYIIQASIHLPVTYITPGEDEVIEEEKEEGGKKRYPEDQEERMEILGLEEMDNFLYESVYETYLARNQQRAFLEALIPYILPKRKSLPERSWSMGPGKERRIRQVPPPILGPLLQLLHRTGRDQYVEEILNHLDIHSGVGDPDLMLRQARASQAWSSLLRIWSLGVGDWVGGVVELLGEAESLVRIRRAERCRMERLYGPNDTRMPMVGEEDAVLEVERVEGNRVRREMWSKWERSWNTRMDRMIHPLFAYLDKALLGRLEGNVREGLVRGRTDLYRYLLEGEKKEEDRRTPLVRLMHLDTRRTMSMMERALEDAYLDKKPMAPDNPRPDWVIGQVSRQGILEGILRAVGLYDDGEDDLVGTRMDTTDTQGQERKREMSKEERRQKRRSWSISGLAPGQYPLSPTASGQLLGRQNSLEMAMEDQVDGWSIREISQVACMVSRAYSRYHPGTLEGNKKNDRKAPKKGRVVRWGDEVGASIVSGPTVPAVATASTASKISYVSLGRETLQNIVYALVRDTDVTTHEERQSALEDLLKVHAPAAPEAMERMYEKAGFYRVLESVYRKTHRYGRIVETYLMDPKRRHGVFEAVRRLLSERARSVEKGRLLGRKRTDVRAAVWSRMSELVEVDGAETADLVSDLFEGDHERVVQEVLDPNADRVYGYLRGLLGSKLSRKPSGDRRTGHSKGGRVKVPVSLHERYISLLCARCPDEVLGYVKRWAKEVDEVSGSILTLCRAFGVVDAAVWLYERRGSRREGLGLLLSELGVFSNGAEDIVDEERVGKLLNASVDVCSRASLAREEERGQDDKRSTEIEDTGEVEAMWFDLLRAYLACVRRAREVGGGKSRLTVILNRILPHLLSSLSSGTKNRASQGEGGGSALVDMVIAAVRATSDQNPSYNLGDIRDLVKGTVDLAKFEARLLGSATRLVQQDVDGEMRKVMRGRGRGWRMVWGVQCGLCRRSMVQGARVQEGAGEGEDDRPKARSSGYETPRSSGPRSGRRGGVGGEMYVFRCGHGFHGECIHQGVGASSMLMSGVHACPVCQRVSGGKGKRSV